MLTRNSKLKATDTLPASPTPRASERIRAQDERAKLPRKRICNARVRVPAREPTEGDVLFTCNLRHVSAETPHCETGRIRSRSGKIVTYQFFWSDTNPNEIWRQDGNPNPR